MKLIIGFLIVLKMVISLIFLEVQGNPIPDPNPALSGNLNYNSIGAYNFSNVFIPVGSGISWGINQDINIELPAETTTEI
jgi:hypothetical protein